MVRRSTMALYAFVRGLIVAAAAVTSAAAQDQQRLNINGIWIGDDGTKIAIKQMGTSVRATFLSASGCPAGGARDYFFQGTLGNDNSISGKLLECSDQRLVSDCHVSSVFETTFQGTAASRQIAGTKFWPGMRFGIDDLGHYINCSPDKRWDKQVNFILKGLCDRPKLDAVRRDIRALKESADLSRKNLTTAIKDRDNARDGLWGHGGLHTGSIAAYLTSVAGILSADPEANELFGWATSALSIAQDPESSTSPETWADLGSNLASSDFFLDHIDQDLLARFENFSKTADELARAGDLEGATRYYLKAANSVGRIPDTPVPWNRQTSERAGNLVGFILGIIDLARSTNELEKDIRTWMEANDEVNRIQKEIDDLDDQIQKLIDEVGKLAPNCGEVVPGQPQSSSMNRFWPKQLNLRPVKLLVSGESQRIHASLRRSSIDGNSHGNPTTTGKSQPDVDKMRAALHELSEFQGLTEDIQTRFRDHIFVPLSPFILRFSKQMEPRLLLELVKAALPDLESVKKDLDQAKLLFPKIKNDLNDSTPRAGNPPTSSASALAFESEAIALKSKSTATERSVGESAGTNL